MSDAAMAEELIEPVPPMPPAPEAAAPVAERVLPEIEHPVGPLRQKIIDHFVDSEGDQSMAQIIAGLGGTVSRNTIESAVRREYEAGRLVRVSPRVYRLAPPPALNPTPPPPPPPPDEASLFEAP